jgi:hypothetical protein
MSMLKSLILAAGAAMALSACAGGPPANTTQSKATDIVAGGPLVRLGKSEATTYKGLSAQSWVKDEDNKSKAD